MAPYEILKLDAFRCVYIYVCSLTPHNITVIRRRSGPDNHALVNRLLGQA